MHLRFAASPIAIAAISCFSADLAQAQERDSLQRLETIRSINLELRDSGRSGAERLRKLVRERAGAFAELMSLDPAQAVSAALPEELARNLRAQFPSDIESRGAWEGEATAIVADDFERGASRTAVSIHAGGENLRVSFAGAAPRLHCGAVLSATGIRLGDQVAAITSTVTGGSSAACGPLGDQSTAVLLADFGAARLPAPITPGYVHGIFFGPGGDSLDGFWREASYGKTSASGGVFGPFTLDEGLTCGQTGAVADAAVEAADSSVDFRKYSRIFIVMPNTGACAAGAGTIGLTSLRSPTKGRFIASVAWLRGDAMVPRGAAVQLAAHEGGHNLGLRHAASLAFESAPLGLPGSGARAEYGDRFSSMGAGWGHYAAPHKSSLGWLDGGNVVSADSGGTFSIQPYESGTAGPQALRVRRGSGEEWLWLEYRQPGGGGTGALIHLEDPSGYTQLLAFNLAAPGDFLKPALAPGSSWSDPYSGLTLAVDGASPSGLSVTVSYETPCAVLSAPGAAMSAIGGLGGLGVAASGGCGWTATGNTSWITVIDGGGTGSGTVAYSLAANPDASPRTGSISIGRQTYAITQSGAGDAPFAATAIASAAAIPTPGEMNPPFSSPSATQTFTFTFSDADGWQDLNVVNILMNRFLDGANACYLAYQRPTNTLFLVPDVGPSAPLLGMVLNGTPGSVSNTQCSVNNTGSSASGSGNTLTLTLNITLNAVFAGNKVVYLAAGDSTGNNSGWRTMGVRPVPPLPVTPTRAISALPGRGAGRVQGFTYTFTDVAGWAHLNVLNVLIHNSLDGASACYVAYAQQVGTLFLVADAGPQAPLISNPGGAVGNSQCTITGWSAVGNGNTLTLTLNITFSASFLGNRVAWAAAGDVSGNNSGWQALGTYLVQ